jgi:NCAIR mutase (PurE)-related protein
LNAKQSERRGADLPTVSRAWLVTGPIGRGAAFAIDFGVALVHILRSRAKN